MASEPNVPGHAETRSQRLHARSSLGLWGREQPAGASGAASAASACHQRLAATPQLAFFGRTSSWRAVTPYNRGGSTCVAVVFAKAGSRHPPRAAQVRTGIQR